MNYSLRLTLRLPGVPIVGGPGVVARVRDRFNREAGALVVSAIREHLGTNDLYTLNPGYAAKKQTMLQFRRVPGKQADQPLILTRDMYDHVVATPTSDGFEVKVEDGHGVAADGFDYAEDWEDRVAFLWRGMQDVQDQLPDLLLDIISQEMLL